MKFGLFGINNGIFAESRNRVTNRPGGSKPLVSSRSGRESTSCLPDPQVPPSPSAPQTPIADTSTWLAFLAGQCETLKLGTGIIILPQRNPVELAKELATVDVVSQGRLVIRRRRRLPRARISRNGDSLRGSGCAQRRVHRRDQSALDRDEPDVLGTIRCNFLASTRSLAPFKIRTPRSTSAGTVRQRFDARFVAATAGTAFLSITNMPRTHLKTLGRNRRERKGGTRRSGELEISITPLPRASVDDAIRYRDMGVDRLTLSSGCARRRPLNALD